MMALSPDLVAPFLAGFAATLAVCIAILMTRRWHGRLSSDSVDGPQKFHLGAVPRIGGLAVYVGWWGAAAMAPVPVRSLMMAVGVATAPALAAGLAEDLFKGGRILLRLCATLVSGFIFCLVTGYAVTRVEIHFLDGVMALMPVALVFTVVSMAWFAQAVNIVDGFHGLAVGTGIVMLAAFAVFASALGDFEMTLFCCAAIGVLAGFLIINFPLGLIFLGDGGAYFLGLVVGAVAVMIPARNPDASPWISVVVIAYPLLEAVFAAARKFGRGHAPWQPDRLHLHMLVYRRLCKRFVRNGGDTRFANPAAGAAMWAWPLASLASVLLLSHTRTSSLIMLGVLAVLYAAVYRFAVNGGPRRPAAARAGHASLKDGADGSS